LASIYYEKIVFNTGDAWGLVIKYIIDKYRNSAKDRNVHKYRKIEKDRISNFGMLAVKEEEDEAISDLLPT
jgi:hypothetical protein